MRRERTTTQKTLLVGALAFFIAFASAPFLCMIITTFKSSKDLYNKVNNPFFYNIAPTMEHLDYLFQETEYTRFILNSLIIGVVVVLITLILAVPAAYSLARLTGRWGERAGILIFLVYLVPPTLLYIPMNRIITIVGLRNTIGSLILTYPTITVPFATWLLMGFFKSIPRELEEAALVDGYNRVSAFIRVVMPLSLPGMISVTVFTFTLTLHEFIYALAFVSSSNQRTISVGVPTELVRGDVFFWQSLLAAAVIIAIPVGLIYNMFLNRLVEGFTMGAVKG